MFTPSSSVARTPLRLAAQTTRATRAMARATAAMALAAVAQIAQAQDHLQQVRSQLGFVRTTVLGAGWHETHDTKTGSMRDGATREFSIHLDAGRSYRIVGVCDDDCDDLDLTLQDARQRLVDEDLGVDAMPIVRARPQRSQEHTLRVTMVSCRSEPCRFGIAVYAN